MDLFEKLISQLAAVQDVWLPFLTAVAIVCVIAWRIVDYGYKTRLTNADSTNELLERRINEYQDKLSGATPDEAKARMDALEARLDALGPRKITQEQREKMAPVLDRCRGLIEIAADASLGDAIQLQKGLTAVFNASGWTVRPMSVVGVGNPPASGFGLRVPDMNALTLQEKTIADAFNAAGIAFNLQQKPEMWGMEEPGTISLILSHPFQD